MLCSFDQVAQRSDERKAFIRRAVLGQNCHVAVDIQVIGYAVLEYSFFEMGFVSMLYVHPKHRHGGVGAALMRHLESLCRTQKLFTSTNLSNQPMQTLLSKLGYKLSGVIHDLDEDDPELVYVKYLSPESVPIKP
jgi:GNAT superfamily N-acetyltransferase